MAVLMVALGAGTAEAQPVAIPGLFNTGVGGGGVPLPDGSLDPHYALTVNPQGGAGPYATDQSSWQFSSTYWIPDTTTSKWISPQANYVYSSGHKGTNDATGTYTYQTTFSLIGLNPATAFIAGQYATDDAMVNVLINGTSTGISTPASSYALFTPFVIDSGFQAGTNTLEFIVQNFAPVDSDSDPSGLQIQLAGTALPQAQPIPEPASIALLAGATGLLLRRGRGWRTGRIAA